LPEWVIPLLTAIGGALVAIIIRESIEWYRRPRLKIDFEKRAGQIPYITDLHDSSEYKGEERTSRIKYFRIKVSNEGKKPAMNCEAKLEITTNTEDDLFSNKVALHWTRNDPKLYSEYRYFDEHDMWAHADKSFAPISLNINDEENIDVLRLTYSLSTLPDTDTSPRPESDMESVSLRQLVLQPKTIYQCKVTVYASNTTPKSFKFKVNWDGTVEGFGKAFTKD
jgi:hypothetical protein